MLHKISTRRNDEFDVDVQPEEIRMLELIKIIVDGGWIIDNYAF